MTPEERTRKLFATIVKPSTGNIEPRRPGYSEVLAAIREAEAAARAEQTSVFRALICTAKVAVRELLDSSEYLPSQECVRREAMIALARQLHDDIAAAIRESKS